MPPVLSFSACREVLVIASRDVELGEEIGKEVEIRHETIGKIRHVHQRGDVRDAVRGLFVQL